MLRASKITKKEKKKKKKKCEINRLSDSMSADQLESSLEAPLIELVRDSDASLLDDVICVICSQLPWKVLLT